MRFSFQHQIMKILHNGEVFTINDFHNQYHLVNLQLLMVECFLRGFDASIKLDSIFEVVGQIFKSIIFYQNQKIYK